MNLVSLVVTMKLMFTTKFMVGGLEYIGNLQNLVTSYYFEENLENFHSKGQKHLAQNRVRLRNFKKFFQPVTGVPHH